MDTNELEAKEMKNEKTPSKKNLGVGKVDGRPTLYKKNHDERAFKLSLLGLTDVEMANIFDVCEATITIWKNTYPSFLAAIKKGKEDADADIAASLYQRAKGYSHKDVHISSYEGQITKTEITKYYPPDTAAAFIWLKNRQAKKWRDRAIMDDAGNPVSPVRVNIGVQDASKDSDGVPAGITD